MFDQSTEPRIKVLIVGVGGQGVLTAAKMLGDAALHAGFGVTVGQLHGMSQRGGSVEAGVLIGEGESSFIEEGAADIVLGFEPLEVLRALPKMS
ncbi:MAG: 2-oxoacid:acceptor oxidoreductase family protein, partial [Pseudomonadota bacterium]